MITRIFHNLLLSILFCFLGQLIYGQGDQAIGNSNIYEVPKNKYIDSYLHNIRNSFLEKLHTKKESSNRLLKKNLDSKKDLLSVKGIKDLQKLELVSKNILSIEKEIADFNQAINQLNFNFTGKKANKQLKEVLVNISEKYFPNIKIEKSQEENSKKTLKPLQKQSPDKTLHYGDCRLEFNGIAPNTLEKKIQTSFENLISFTHPKLEAFYKETSFLTADASIVMLGKKKFLTLEIIIRSKDAIRNYGVIQAGSTLKIDLINGETVYLFAQSNTIGHLIPQTTHTQYQVIYQLDKQETKLLKKSEINTIGLMWSSGYENYNIYNIDILKNQLECISNIK